MNGLPRASSDTKLRKKHKDSSPCTCDECVSYCNRPCWGTPEEIKQVIKSGLGHMLMLDHWARSPNDVMILCPANPGKEGMMAPETSFFEAISRTGELFSGCVFLNQGLCDLHSKGLKPIEGRCTHHEENEGESQTLHQDVAMSWNSTAGRNLVKQWKRRHFKQRREQ